MCVLTCIFNQSSPSVFQPKWTAGLHFESFFGTTSDTLQSEAGEVKNVLPPAREHRNEVLEDMRFPSFVVLFLRRVFGDPFLTSCSLFSPHVARLGLHLDHDFHKIPDTFAT